MTASGDHGGSPPPGSVGHVLGIVQHWSQDIEQAGDRRLLGGRRPRRPEQGRPMRPLKVGSTTTNPASVAPSTSRSFGYVRSLVPSTVRASRSPLAANSEIPRAGRLSHVKRASSADACRNSFASVSSPPRRSRTRSAATRQHAPRLQVAPSLTSWTGGFIVPTSTDRARIMQGTTGQRTSGSTAARTSAGSGVTGRAGSVLST